MRVLCRGQRIQPGLEYRICPQQDRNKINISDLRPSGDGQTSVVLRYFFLETEIHMRVRGVDDGATCKRFIVCGSLLAVPGHEVPGSA